MSDTSLPRRDVHSGTLHDTALKMALIFAAHPDKFAVSPELMDAYRYTGNDGAGTLEVKPLEDCTTDRDGFKKATLYAGVSSDTNFGRSERIEDGEAHRNAGQTKTAKVATQLIFRFECLNASDARHFMGTMATYLFAMEDPFILDFGGERGHVSDYSVQRERGPIRFSPPDSPAFWRIDIIVEIAYHLTVKLNTVSLPLSDIAMRAGVVKVP